MLETKFVASIAEHDIDLLVLEELSVSDEFRKWFSSKVFGYQLFQKKIGTWHSVSDAQLGESDLIFIFEAVEGPRTAILIENKIDAPPQPQQGERYRLRGEKGLKEGYWEQFKTCVIAPDKYLSSSKHSESYDIEISYEDIMDYFHSKQSNDERFSYKANLLLDGIDKNRRGYQPEYDASMSTFVSEYFAFVSANYTHLAMQEAKPRPAGSTWVHFYPNFLPKGSTLAHQLTAGYVKLFFYGQASEFEALQERYKSKLPNNATMELAGKSVAIIMEVPKIDPISISFSDQQIKVEEALNSLSVLESACRQ